MPLHTLNIALADDDQDDRTLFKEAIDEIRIKTKLSLFKDNKIFNGGISGFRKYG
jgi:hypothetical protein